MFDIGFIELVVMSVVALIVIGPEQLPGALRSLVKWTSKLKRAITDTRQQLEDEIGFDKIRSELDEEEAIKEITRTKMELTEIVSDANKELTRLNQTDPRYWPGMPPPDSAQDDK